MIVKKTVAKKTAAKKVIAKKTAVKKDLPQVLSSLVLDYGPEIFALEYKAKFLKMLKRIRNFEEKDLIVELQNAEVFSEILRFSEESLSMKRKFVDDKLKFSKLDTAKYKKIVNAACIALGKEKLYTIKSTAKPNTEIVAKVVVNKTSRSKFSKKKAAFGAFFKRLKESV